MSRPIDHIVLPCRDLAEAAARFTRLGFQVGARNRHPWGTENHVIQFPGVFLELIALAPDYEPLDREADAFPFAGFLAGQAGSKQPSGMVVLRSEHAAADAREFAASGIGSSRMLHFARDSTAPDGSTRTVAFDLAFAEAPLMPDLGFFVCEQLRPENFWNPAFQLHPNGVRGLRGIVIVAGEPSDHAAFLAAFSGQPAVRVKDGAIELDTGGGSIEVLTPAVWRARAGDRFAAPSKESASPSLAALRFETADLAALPRWTNDAALHPSAAGAGCLVLPDQPLGPVLVFEAEHHKIGAE